jgi:predicted RNase H-like nuclease (RuvC/YqgF family)
MKKQSLIALAPMAIFAFAMSAMAEETVVVERTAEVSEILNAGAEKVQAAKKSQVTVDRIADQTDGLLQEFKQVNKQIESLRVYNSQLERQIVSQKRMMVELEESIENATVIERGISPLMANMLDALEDFVGLDMPFKLERRQQAIAELYVNLDSAKFSAAEKFRQILEVYDIESDYSLSMESYTDQIDLNGDGSLVEVQILRIGRVALTYQSKDKSKVGVWDKNSKSWQPLGSEYRRAVDQAIRIAVKLAPQDVIEVPITAPETAQ